MDKGFLRNALHKPAPSASTASSSLLFLFGLAISCIEIGLQAAFWATNNDSFNPIVLALAIFGMALCGVLKISESMKIHREQTHGTGDQA